LATDSATAIEPGKVVFRSSYNSSQVSGGINSGR
jgi:hypothetical protein